MRRLRPKFKKKIALLLNEVLRESREFAAAYTQEVERRSPSEKIETVEMVSDPTAGKAFGEGSEEFEEGLDKIPPELLELFKSQFGSSPHILVKGALRFVKRGEDAEEDAMQTEDADTISELEEEESE